MIRTRIDRFNFRGALSPPAVASREGIWCKADTSSAGAPLVASVSGGPMELTLAADEEVENICLYTGDILPYDIDDLVRVEWTAKLTASLNAAVSGAFGIASARNDALNSVAAHAWFHFTGSNAIVVETDDGTTDNDDVATGISLSTTYRRFAIEFGVGNNPRNPPSLSQGGKSDVRFYISNDNGSLRRVATATRFDMSAYTGNLQLLAQLQKTSATAVATLSLLEAEVEYRLPC